MIPSHELNGKQGGSDGAAQAVLDPQATQMLYSNIRDLSSMCWTKCTATVLQSGHDTKRVLSQACWLLGYVWCVHWYTACVSCNLKLKIKLKVVLVCSAYTVVIERIDRLCQR